MALWLSALAAGTAAPAFTAARAAEARPKPFPKAALDRPVAAWPRHTLHAEETWLLNLPGGERFDASALLLLPDGTLLTLNDRGPTLFRIAFLTGTNAADLVPVPEWFAPERLAAFAAEKLGRYDSEGLARDARGRLYLCEEANRWVLRCDPASGQVERLAIDWSPVQPYFSATDRNASFEGIAVGGDTLYVANERQLGRLIAVDLTTLQVTGSFRVHAAQAPARDVHYSDLSWFQGRLYVLLRASRCILEVDPATRRVEAQYDFGAMEQAGDVAYRWPFPTGFMEGLAVTAEAFWLVTDNNGCERLRAPGDRRPTLFKCRRPALP